MKRSKMNSRFELFLGEQEETKINFKIKLHDKSKYEHENERTNNKK